MLLFREGFRAAAKLRALNQSLATIEFKLDGTITRANQNFLDLVAYTIEEIRGKHHAIFVEPAFAASDEYRRFWSELQTGKFQAAEFRRIGKSGRPFWIQATYNPVFDMFGRPVRILKCATDISAQKWRQAENAGQIDAINKSQGVVHFAMDGVIEDANQAFLDCVGYSREELVGKHHSFLVEPNDARSSEYSEFWQRLRKGDFQKAEFRRIGKNNKEIWLQATYNPIFDSDGRPRKVVKYATDVTAEKIKGAGFAGEIQAINRSQCVIQFDMDGVVLDANRNFLDAFGYELSEVVGRHHEMFVEHSYAASDEYREFWQKLRRGEFHSAIYRRSGKNGRDIFIQATYNPIHDLRGIPFKVVKYAVDITSEMRRRESIKAAARETSQSVQVVASAAEEMSAAIAEISNVMNASRSAVEDIYRHAVSADRFTAELKQSTGEMDSVIRTINQITKQINLLALNATIESARAGEAGLGFTTVANEVKILANRAASATMEISAQIEAVQTVSGEVFSAIAQIAEVLDTVQSYVTQATVAMEEQNAATREISNSMTTAAANVTNISETLAAA